MEIVISAIRAALHLCAVSIIPSLFLFLVLSDLILSVLLSNEKFPSPKYMTFFLGALCGFPTGAVICERLCREGMLCEKDAARLLPLCNCVSPAFVIGAIGSSMLGDVRLGMLLYFAQITASVLLLLPLRIHLTCTKKDPQTFSFSQAFFGAVEKSIGSILRICALICLFSAFLSILKRYSDASVYRLFAAILEIGSGSGAAADLYSDSPLHAIMLCAFGCGWSGICVHFQILSVLKSIKVKCSHMILSKGIVAFLSVILAALGYKLFFCT